MTNNIDKIRNLKNQMNELLNKYRTEAEFTHVCLGGATVTGKFNFDRTGEKSLYKLLSKALKYNLCFSIGEIPKEYGPIKVDVDLNFPVDEFNEGRLYDDNTIKTISEIYRNVIQKYINCLDSHLDCYVFEKENYSIKNSEIKDGFHLIFPNLNVHKKIRHLIVNDVIEELNEKDLFSHLSNPNVIDTQVVSSNATDDVRLC